MDDRNEKVVVGVNKYVMPEEKPIHYLRLDESIELEQIEKVTRVKASRDPARVEKRLKQLADTCRNGGNVMPVLIDAVKDYVSLGEIWTCTARCSACTASPSSSDGRAGPSSRRRA